MKRHQIVALASCIIVLVTTESGAKPADAGSGESHPYIIRPDGSAQPFDSSKSYFSVTAVSWFVNKQGNWLKSELASGSVSIKCNGTTFNFPLGSFTLAKQAKTAPIFDQPLLPTTPFDGSTITIQAFLTGMKQDTVLGSLLKQLASDAMNYGNTALGTLALSSAYPGLSQLSSSANNVASSLVQQLGKKTVPIFDAGNGISLTLGPGELKGNLFYVLLYKGRTLNGHDLKMAPDNLSVLEEGNRLSDGAWILFEVAKGDLYAGPRPWTDARRLAINELRVQMTRYWNDQNIGADLKKALETTPQGAGKSLGDRFVYVSNLVEADKALTYDQLLQEELSVNEYVDLARRAIQSSNPKLFFVGADGLEGKTNVSPEALNELTKAVEKAVQAQAHAPHPISPPKQVAAQVVTLQARKNQALAEALRRGRRPHLIP